MKRRKYTKTPAWYTKNVQDKLKNIKHDISIYNDLKAGLPVIEVQMRHNNISAASVHRSRNKVQGMLDRNELDLSLFDS